MRTPVLALAAALALASLGCEERLERAISDVRAAAPGVCADWCESRLACEFGRTDSELGGLHERAFSGAVERCILECAWYSQGGLYFYRTDPEDDGLRLYQDHLPGSSVTDALDCLVEAGAYACDRESDPDRPTYGLAPSTEEGCQEAETCIGILPADFGLGWTTWVFGGGCVPYGEDVLEAPFFL